MTDARHCRYFVDPATGNPYRIRLCPLERREGAGVYQHIGAVVFETLRGEWAGLVPVPRSVGFEWLTVRECVHLLEQAGSTGESLL